MHLGEYIKILNVRRQYLSCTYTYTYINTYIITRFPKALGIERYNMPVELPKQDANLTETEKVQIENMKAQIDNLKNGNPKTCEGLIRELHEMISNVSKESEKKQLLFHLKGASCNGLSSELRKLVEENGLAMEALYLVLKYLTTKNELAHYIFNNPLVADGIDPLDVVKKRLGPKLEVLGGLSAKGIDVSKDWVKKLTNVAPSLQSLSRLSVEDLKVKQIDDFKPNQSHVYLSTFQLKAGQISKKQIYVSTGSANS